MTEISRFALSPTVSSQLVDSDAAWNVPHSFQASFGSSGIFVAKTVAKTAVAIVSVMRMFLDIGISPILSRRLC